MMLRVAIYLIQCCNCLHFFTWFRKNALSSKRYIEEFRVLMPVYEICISRVGMKLSPSKNIFTVFTCSIEQCEEEALSALVKTHCTLENIEPALDLLTNTSSCPQSVEQWTLAQVR